MLNHNFGFFNDNNYDAFFIQYDFIIPYTNN